jgi:uncharacterized protein (DUF4415 family)
MTDKTDWKKLKALTDADIAKAVGTDPDTFFPDADWMAQAQIVMPRTKKIVTLRLDPHVLEWFMQAGRGYQTRINAVLKAFVEAQEQRPR